MYHKCNYKCPFKREEDFTEGRVGGARNVKIELREI